MYSLWDFSAAKMEEQSCHALSPLASVFYILQRKNLTDKMLLYRMYPVVSMNGRVFLDRDVTIGGYKFPKNVGLRFPALYFFLFSLKFLMASCIVFAQFLYSVFSLPLLSLPRRLLRSLTMPLAMTRTHSQSRTNFYLRGGFEVTVSRQMPLAQFRLGLEWGAALAAGLLSLRCI